MTITRKFFWGHFLFLRVNTSYQQNSILVKGIRHELLNQRTLSNHILDHLRHILNSLIIHGMHNIHDINDKHYKQAQLGVPHSEAQVELQSYLNWGQSWGGHRTYFVVVGGEQLGWGHRTTIKERA